MGFWERWLLADEPLAETHHSMIQTAQSCGAVLRNVVNDTLDLSKIESGTIELQNSCFIPAGLIKETTAVIESQLVGSDVSLDVQLATSLPPALIGDYGRCQQIIMNLLANAVKFTKAGAITVRTEFIDKQWQISVQDTGPGIPQEDQETIFELFSKATLA